MLPNNFRVKIGYFGFDDEILGLGMNGTDRCILVKEYQSIFVK
jgi:hypothetical protein